MLKYNNDQELKERGVNIELLYFYQRWQELVDNRTVDVYQYGIHNLYTSIYELLDVIKKTINGLYTSDHNIDCCCEETLSILNIDDVLVKYEKPLLDRLRWNIGKKPSKIHEKKSLKAQLQYALSKLSPIYLDLLLDEIWNDIITLDVKRMDNHINSLISQCIFNGWSSRALLDIVRFFRGDETLQNKWNVFRNVIASNHKINHDILISIPFQGNKQVTQEQAIITLEKLGLEVKTYDQLTRIFSEIPNIRTTLKSEKKYIKLSIESPDVYSAAHLGVKYISDKVNIASFYNLIIAWDLKSMVIISINAITKYQKIITAEDLYKTYDYLDSSSKIFESTKKIFFEPQKYIIQDKLKGAFAYTNISRASLFQEEKYMNIWVALESLARTDMYNDIISNVKETLPPALCLRYVYRTIRNFAEDCSRCGVKFKFSSYEIDINQDTKQKLVKQTIKIFKDDSVFKELKEKCLVNELLSKRCTDIFQLVNDVEYAKSKIENHYKKVKWQIQRLYRIRNEIAHSALQKNISLIIYIEHLYDYLATFISEIVTCLENKNLKTLEEVYCVIKDNYDVFIELQKDRRNYNLIEDGVLTTGIIDLVLR
ncbi:MAG: hypothetical protein WCR27_03630 [Eubacteriales bacterium]